MIIPVEKLSAEAVQGLIEEFITREGTDYGAVEFSLEDKVEQVKDQLLGGEIVVVFDAVQESVSIKSRRDADLAEREYQQQLDANHTGVSSVELDQPDLNQPDFNQDHYADDEFYGN